MKMIDVSAEVATALTSSGICEASLEAEVLVRYVLDMDRVDYFSSLTETFKQSEGCRLNSLVCRRMSGEPLAYVLGCREFYGLNLVVDKNVLVPRQETESLAEEVIEFVRTRFLEQVTIADIGTGSGAIALALASNLPGARLLAIDTSKEALAVAQVNVNSHGFSDRIDLIQGDLLEPLDYAVDIIVSNPPYLSTSDIARLALEVQSEPTLALDGGDDGLDVTRRLFENAPAYLNPRGAMFVEIDPPHLHDAIGLARAAFPQEIVGFSNDLLGLPRIVRVELKRVDD